MKSIGNTVDIMQILVVSIFTKKGRDKKVFIYLFITYGFTWILNFCLFAEIRPSSSRGKIQQIYQFFCSLIE